MRVSDSMLNELIKFDGTLGAGPISSLGVLRLALDLRDARAALTEPTKPKHRATLKQGHDGVFRGKTT